MAFKMVDLASFIVSKINKTNNAYWNKWLLRVLAKIFSEDEPWIHDKIAQHG